MASPPGGAIGVRRPLVSARGCRADGPVWDRRARAAASQLLSQKILEAQRSWPTVDDGAALPRCFAGLATAGWVGHRCGIDERGTRALGGRPHLDRPQAAAKHWTASPAVSAAPPPLLCAGRPVG